jgi:hypothetical protein
MAVHTGHLLLKFCDLLMLEYMRKREKENGG